VVRVIFNRNSFSTHSGVCSYFPQVGPEIAVLKTHVDQLSDWTPDVTAQIEKVYTRPAVFFCLLSGLALFPLTSYGTRLKP
jgi:hypothetical protein